MGTVHRATAKRAGGVTSLGEGPCKVRKFMTGLRSTRPLFPPTSTLLVPTLPTRASSSLLFVHGRARRQAPSIPRWRTNNQFFEHPPRGQGDAVRLPKPKWAPVAPNGLLPRARRIRSARIGGLRWGHDWAPRGRWQSAVVTGGPSSCLDGAIMRVDHQTGMHRR